MTGTNVMQKYVTLYHFFTNLNATPIVLFGYSLNIIKIQSSYIVVPSPCIGSEIVFVEPCFLAVINIVKELPQSY